jgi:hypothetical protein
MVDIMNYIELAKQVGLDWQTGWTLEDDEPNRFEALCKLAAAQEREACAKVCEDLDAWNMDDPASTAVTAIRARGEA